MKDISEIKECKRLSIDMLGTDGGKGTIAMPMYNASVIWSNGAGWDHVSMAPYKARITPSWDDMCILKKIFFKDDEAVIEIHPPEDQYVNNKSNCLHLWRCSYKEMLLPPSALVGIRKGQSSSELSRELKEAYELAGEKY